MTNEVIQNIITRRSIKQYKDQQITDEELQTVLDAGLYAPSGMGMQSPVMVVVQDKDTMAHIEDASCVLDTMMLAAHSIGLASRWIHRERQMFETEEGKELMKKWGIPENFAGVGALALGYADCELPEPKERREGRIIYADK